MSQSHTGNAQPFIDQEEHRSVNGVNAKAVVQYALDTTAGLTPVPVPFVNKPFDYVGVNTSGSSSDVYTFYQGGSGGTLVSTVTLVYSDSTKGTLTSVART